jgi:hypothetical protein
LARQTLKQIAILVADLHYKATDTPQNEPVYRPRL